MADVSPRQGELELFYLRLLLRHVTGATSFESLRTVNGETKATFKEACASLNLLRNGEEFDLCLREAALKRHPKQLGRLFALILCIATEEDINQAPALWRTHRKSLCEDFSRRGMNREAAQRACIAEIDRMLERNTTAQLKCSDLGITWDDDIYEEEWDEAEREDDDIPMIGYDDLCRPEYDRNSLTPDQTEIFLKIIVAVCRNVGRDVPEELRQSDGYQRTTTENHNGAAHLFFLDGPGGTGKTHLYNCLISYVTDMLRLPVIAVAWTGIAANVLTRGKTAHRTFRLPLNIHSTCTVGWHVEAGESEKMLGVALILWDEAPMSHRVAVEAVDRYLREITERSSVPMGGKCCVFGGDFRQVLPVVPQSHRAAVIDACIKQLEFWKEFQQLKLTQNLRAQRQALREGTTGRVAALGNRTFEEWLLLLGEGKLPYVAFEGLRSLPRDLIEIPRQLNATDVNDLLSFTFPEGFLTDDVGERAILCPTNQMVQDINQLILERLEGEHRTYVSVDEIKNGEEDELTIPQDVLNSVNIASLPPHELELKIGAVVMLLRNLDVECGNATAPGWSSPD